MEDFYDGSSSGSPMDADDEASAQADLAPSFVRELRPVASFTTAAADRFKASLSPTASVSLSEKHEPVSAVFDASTTHGMNSLVEMNDLRDALCDVELVVQKRVIRAQRVVLAACSPYFRAMLAGQMTERNQHSIELHDVEYDPVNAIVDFFYSAHLEITLENVQQLMVTASILQVLPVQTACARYMHGHLEVANCLSVLQFAMLYGCHDLRQAAFKYTEMHFSEIVQTEEFLEQPLRVVDALVSSTRLAVEAEEEIFLALMRWTEHDLESRAVNFCDLLKHIRLWQLSLPFLATKVCACKLIRSSLKCRDLVDAAKDFHLLPEVRSTLQLLSARPCTVGVLYVVGGMNNLGLPVERVEKHALDHCCKLLATPALEPRPVSGEAAAAAGGVGAGGGDRQERGGEAAEVDSVIAERRFEAPPLNTARSGLSVAIIKSKLYAVGGHLPGNHGPEGNGYLNSAECYDPASRKWTHVTPMKHARRYVAVTSMEDKLYAIGGCNAREVLDVTECYDPDTNRWTDCAAMRVPRRHAGAAALGQLVYVVGGHDGNCYLRSVEAFDPKANQWTNICSMAGRRGGLGVATVENRLYAVGGYNGSKNLSTVEYLEEGSRSWKMAVPMKTCRSGLAATRAGGRLLVVGGHCGSSYLETTEWFEPRSGVWHSGPMLSLARAVTGVAVFTGKTAALELEQCLKQDSGADATGMEEWNGKWKMNYTSPSRKARATTSSRKADDSSV